MEGISDVVVRRLLAALGGMDLCVTEFIRVVQRPLAPKALLHACPELERGGRTARDVPVMVQLLGGDPSLVAASAQVAWELGAVGVDLNFGCPAKKVNGHDGGAALLRTPERVHRVVEAVRKALPPQAPVSTKVRLGWDCTSAAVEIGHAAESAGSAWLTVHGRTKVQMYKGHADWDRIADVARALPIPVVANGDLFDPDALQRCAQLTGCRAFMLGRGAFRRPNLFRWIRGMDSRAWDPEPSLRLLLRFTRETSSCPQYKDGPRVALNRLKGWLRALSEADSAIKPIFDRVKRQHDLVEAKATLAAVIETKTSSLRSSAPASPTVPSPRSGAVDAPRA